MSFFDDLQRRSRRGAEEHEEYRQPDWAGPPAGVLGGPVAERVVLLHTAALAIAVVGMAAFPTGVLFTLAFLGRDDRFDRTMHMAMHARWAVAGDDLPDDLFRLGVAFSDGRKASTLSVPDFDRDEVPPHPMLMQHGGGGGGGQWSYRYWLWPLPPEGELTFVCEWPAQGIAETRATIDSAPIRAAAARTLALWST